VELASLSFEHDKRPVLLRVSWADRRSDVFGATHAVFLTVQPGRKMGELMASPPQVAGSPLWVGADRAS